MTARQCAMRLHVYCRQRNIVGIGPYEGHMLAVPRHQERVAGQEHAPVAPVHHATSGKMPAEAMQCHAGQELSLLAAPEFYARCRLDDPAMISLMNAHGTAERFPPRCHRPIVVPVGQP
jgi:hypothetical protein